MSQAAHGQKETLEDFVIEALRANGGSASIPGVSQYIWEHHWAELERSGLLYTWQYDIRWAATVLRGKRILRGAKNSPRGVWEIRP